MTKKILTVLFLGLFLAGFSMDRSWTEEPTTKKEIKKKKRKKYSIQKKKDKPPALEHKSTLKIESLPEEKTTLSQSVHVWLKKLKGRVAQSRAKHNQLVAVASVRGKEVTDPPPLYWKGKAVEQPVNPTELNEFDRAIEMAMNGEVMGARSSLEQFMASHPESPLLPDAHETLQMLNQDNTP